MKTDIINKEKKHWANSQARAEVFIKYSTYFLYLTI